MSGRGSRGGRSGLASSIKHLDDQGEPFLISPAVVECLADEAIYLRRRHPPQTAGKCDLVVPSEVAAFRNH